MLAHDGKNNGHLHLSAKWLRGRGWKSNDGIQKAKLELLERGLIVKTREGGLNAGPDRYAVTWLAITNFVGLQIEPKGFHPGAYQLLGPFAQPSQNHKQGEQPAPTPPVVRTAAAHTVKQKCHPAHRDSAAPHTGIVSESTAPRTGAREVSFPDALHRTPETMNSYHCTGVAAVVVRGAGNGRKRVVGKPKAERHGNQEAEPAFMQQEPAPDTKDTATTVAKPSSPCQHINPKFYASLKASEVGRGITWASRYTRAMLTSRCCTEHLISNPSPRHRRQVLP